MAPASALSLGVWGPVAAFPLPAAPGCGVVLGTGIWGALILRGIIPCLPQGCPVAAPCQALKGSQSLSCAFILQSPLTDENCTQFLQLTGGTVGAEHGGLSAEPIRARILALPHTAPPSRALPGLLPSGPSPEQGLLVLTAALVPLPGQVGGQLDFLGESTAHSQRLSFSHLQHNYNFSVSLGVSSRGQCPDLLCTLFRERG